jgi:tetratricopeptide (TPR) repeat protein
MTENEIVERFLSLLSRDWNDPEAIKGFQELREAVDGQSEWPTIIDARLMAREGKAHEAVSSLQEILEREPDNACAALLLAAIRCNDTDQLEEARAICDAMLERGFLEQPHADWLHALTLFRKGVTLGYMYKPDEAIRVYDDVIKRFGDAPEIQLRELVAKAMVNKGLTLGQMGKPDEEISVYDDVIERFGDAPEIQLRGQVAKAMFNKGVALGKMDKHEDAIRVCDEVIERFGDAPEVQLREQVARAMVNKGVALGKMDKHEDAIRVYDAVIERFGDEPETKLREPVARAMGNKGFTFGEMGKPDEAIRVYDAVIERFGDAPEVQLREPVAWAMVNKGVALGRMDKHEDAIRVYDDVIERFGDAPEVQLREPVAWAMVNKGVALGNMDKPDETIRVYDAVIERFGDAPEVQLRELVAKAMVNKGVVLSQMDKPDEAIRIYDDVIERFGDAPEVQLREQVARAMVNKGFMLAKLEKPDEAIEALDEVIQRYDDSSDIPLHEFLISARLGKIACLLILRRDEEALAIFKSLDRFDPTKLDIWPGIESFYTYLHQRLILSGQLTEEGLPSEGRRAARSLKAYLDHILREFDESTRNDYFDKIKAAEKRRDVFLRDPSAFASDMSFVLVLREWNSYTPVIPGQEESDRGGGYFIRHGGEGIVIDPGYDFIENFHNAGGKLSDVNHIIVTHAHDDHTAELEALLMLLYRRWNLKDLDNKPAPKKKQVSLYLSAGVQRKFAGILSYRDEKIKRIVTLSPPSDNDMSQSVGINEYTELTVLPAYHDDVITESTAVGLGFDFQLENGKRRVIFTADSGLYPPKRDNQGKKITNNKRAGEYALDTNAGRALFERYPDKMLGPDLLVAHMGSIKKREFEALTPTDSSIDEGGWYYPNHLGLLGTLTMLDRCRPKAAIISEFGSELKGFHYELVKKLGETLHNIPKAKGTTSELTFVIPGDLTTVYDITNGKFLCHETCEFEDTEELECRETCDCEPEWKAAKGRYNSILVEKGDSRRTYLFKKLDSSNNPEQDATWAEKYYEKFYNHELPYHAAKKSDADS